MIFINRHTISNSLLIQVSNSPLLLIWRKNILRVVIMYLADIFNRLIKPVYSSFKLMQLIFKSSRVVFEKIPNSISISDSKRREWNCLFHEKLCLVLSKTKQKRSWHQNNILSKFESSHGSDSVSGLTDFHEKKTISHLCILLLMYRNMIFLKI